MVPPNPRYSRKPELYPPHLEYHALPIDDTDQEGKFCIHLAVRECWCHPMHTPAGWIHNAMDCREAQERQGKPTKLWISVGAIDTRAPVEDTWGTDAH